MTKLLIVGERHSCNDCIAEQIRLIRERYSEFSTLSFEYITDVGNNAKILNSLNDHLDDYHKVLEPPKGEYTKREIPTWRRWLYLHKPVFETALAVGIAVLPLKSMDDLENSIEEVAKVSKRGLITIVGSAYAEMYEEDRSLIDLEYDVMIPHNHKCTSPA